MHVKAGFFDVLFFIFLLRSCVYLLGCRRLQYYSTKIVRDVWRFKQVSAKRPFFFKPTDNLSQVCNAPRDRSGVYVFYALKNGKIELVYIGRSGEVKPDGSLFIRKAGLGGLRDRLINGKQFGEPRRNSLKAQMLKEQIEALDIYWYATHDDKFIDCPRILENKILLKYFDLYGRLPKWNNEF